MIAFLVVLALAAWPVMLALDAMHLTASARDS